MIDELTTAPDTSTTPTPAPAAPHPAFSILAEIETVLRDLDVIPAHIAAWIKAKLAEAKSKF